jgi:hypothetical protein
MKISMYSVNILSLSISEAPVNFAFQVAIQLK